MDNNVSDEVMKRRLDEMLERDELLERERTKAARQAAFRGTSHADLLTTQDPTQALFNRAIAQAIDATFQECEEMVRGFKVERETLETERQRTAIAKAIGALRGGAQIRFSGGATASAGLARSRGEAPTEEK